MKKQNPSSIEKNRYFIRQQPDEVTCGPTVLHSVYNYYGEGISLSNLISQIKQNPGGGTYAATLGVHALKRGYEVTLYTFNMRVFDPSWFQPDRPGDKEILKQKLNEQADFKKSPKLQQATKEYIDFLEKGGKILFEDMTSKLLQRYLRKGIPIIAGLSSTYLYRSQRECGIGYDDIRGKSAGHFVVLYDYDKDSKQVHIADPYCPKQMHKRKHYQVNLQRLVCSIMLGVLSYDANLLIIQKPGRQKAG